MSKKKVLIVITSLYNGGAEKSLVNFLNELKPDQYDIDLLFFKKEGMFLSQVPKWVNILETPNDIMDLYGSKSPHKKNPFLLLVRYMGTLITRIFKKEVHERSAFRWKYFFTKHIKNIDGQYDVAISYVSGDVLFLVSEKVKAKRKMVFIHNDYRTAKHPKEYERPHLHQMDAIISISDLCVDILKEEFPELKEKIYYLPNITSSNVIRKRAEEFIPKEFDSKFFNILSIGRLSQQKGFDIAIKAASKLIKKNDKFCWYIIGNGEDHDMLETLICENKLENNVFLLGVRENPYPYIKNCDLFAQTSRYEGKSVVLDEAKILAKPILATNYPTVTDQLKNDVEGVVVDINSDKISMQIEILMNQRNILEGFSNYLRCNEYGNQELISEYCELINM